MSVISMTFLFYIFDALFFVFYKHSYFIGRFAVLVTLINILLYCEVCGKNGPLIAIWMVTTTIYIMLLFVGLFAIPITTTLEYAERLCISDVYRNLAVPVWLYIFWSGLVFKLMILPLYYVFVCVIVPQQTFLCPVSTNQGSKHLNNKTTLIF